MRKQRNQLSSLQVNNAGAGKGAGSELKNS